MTFLTKCYNCFKIWQEREAKEAREEREEKLGNQRDPLNPSPQELDSSSQSEESTGSSRAEFQPATELDLPPQSTLLLFLSILLLRCSNWQETLQRTSKSEESPPDICNWPSEETNNSTCSLKPPLLAEVLFPTSTKIS